MEVNKAVAMTTVYHVKIKLAQFLAGDENVLLPPVSVLNQFPSNGINPYLISVMGTELSFLPSLTLSTQAPQGYNSQLRLTDNEAASE